MDVDRKEQPPSVTHESASHLDAVRDYYGRVLATSADLKTDACCAAEPFPAYLRPVAAKLHPEVVERFYGCGSSIPPCLEGATVLDLGCGTGRDAYLVSALVGEKGKVLGVDMTPEQLEIAQRHQRHHADAFGYARSNVTFLHGYIEDLAAAGVEPGSVDVVISNCVVNLSPDKPRVLREIFRALKPGGELYFSDVFCDRRVPAHLATDPVILGECLGGAMYTEDFRRAMRAVGCLDHRTMSSRPLAIQNPDIAAKLEGMTFTSRTIRAFALDLEDQCEDYGQVAVYLGTEANNPRRFALDDHHVFEAHKPMLVCGNTADMLTRTRLAPHFAVTGAKETHFGLFPCGPSSPAAPSGGAAGGACC